MFFTTQVKTVESLVLSFGKILGLVSLVTALAGGLTQSMQAAEPVWTSHGPGVAYLCDRNPRIPLAVHVIRVDRAQKDLAFCTTLGGRNQIGMAILSQHVMYIDPKYGQAVAAVNGDFFNNDPPFIGDPMNLQILAGGELVSSPGADRAFFYIDSKGEPHVTNAVDGFVVIWPNGKSTPIGLNSTPDTGQTVLFTRAAGPSTRVEGVDLVLEKKGDGPWLPLRIGQKYAAKVKAVNRQGYSPIGPDGLVLSLSPRTLNQFPPLTVGMELIISMKTTPDLSGAQVAIGGGPSLLRGGKARATRDFHGWAVRHPRTAMGWNDKYYYLVQVDGRQPRYSMGMTLQELAAYFEKLKCTSAINLDGGGSATAWLTGRLISSPSQGRERPGANALVVVRRK